MAKFVLAGRADCPYYAKAEVLANYLQENLPHFRVHKVTQHPDSWEQWLREVCRKNNWKHDRSPIVWRELLDRGGKGLLLGGFSDFMEHAQEYYNITSDMMSDLMKDIAEENLNTKLEILSEEEESRIQFNPLHIWITSASAPSCYILIPILVNGEVFGMNKEIYLHLLDSSCSMDILQGLVMEAEDLVFPLLHGVTAHSMADDAFFQADVVIILDDTLPKVDQSTEAYIKEATDQCVLYGELIDQNASKAVKVVVAGSSYVNLKALVIMTSAPSINRHNVVALPTQLEYEAKALLARKLHINAAVIKDVVIWGNISGIKLLDLHHAKIYQYESAVWGPPSFSRPLLSLIYDSKWMKNDLLPEWNEQREHRSGMSAANSIGKCLSWWHQDTSNGEIVSLGVMSEGQFELPEGIVYSMPVKFQNGNWEIYTEATVTEEEKETLQRAAKELTKEKGIFLGVPQKTEIVSEEPETSTIIEPEIISTQPETTAAQSDTIATQPETTAAQSDTISTQPETTAAQSDTISTQPVTTAAQSDTISTQPVTTAAQSDTISTQPVTTAAQSDTISTQPETTAAQSDTISTQPVTTAAQSDTISTQPETTAAQSDTISTQPETTAAQSDTISTQSKTTAAQSDTISTQPETTAAQSDTISTQPETTAAQSDTISTQPDTKAAQSEILSTAADTEISVTAEENRKNTYNEPEVTS